MTIVLGWWMAPLLLTIISIAVAVFFTPKESNSASGIGIGVELMLNGLIGGIFLLIALVVSLVGWIVYLLLT